MDIPRAKNGISGMISTVVSGGQAGSRLLQIPVTHIVRNPNQPRKYFDAEAIESLATSIASQGIIQPIAVSQVGAEEFEIIAGERRWLAAKKAGLSEVPAVVHDVKPDEALVYALVENVVREDLSPIETAKAYAQLIDENGITTADLALALGKSRPAVANTLRLLELPEEALVLIEQGNLSEGHGRALLGLADRNEQRRFARQAADHKMSVRSLESLVRKLRNHVASTAVASPVSEEVRERAAAAAAQLFGVNTAIRPGKKVFRLELQCHSMDELLGVISTMEQAAEQPQRA